MTALEAATLAYWKTSQRAFRGDINSLSRMISTISNSADEKMLRIRAKARRDAEIILIKFGFPDEQPEGGKNNE